MPQQDIPHNAQLINQKIDKIKYRLLAGLFLIPVFLLIFTAFYLKYITQGKILFEHINIPIIVAISLFNLFPHEFFHLVGFTKNNRVYVWIYPRKIAVFVYPEFPLSRERFMWSCMLPGLTLSVVPLFVWVLIGSGLLAEILFLFAVINLGSSAGDFLCTWVASKLPKQSHIQFQGLNWYWFPKEAKVCKYPTTN